MGFLKVAFAPDGASILTGTTDGNARLWDLDGNLLRVFGGHEKQITTLAFSDDGRYILTGSLDARLWDTSGCHLHTYTRDQSRGVVEAVFSKSGDVLIGYIDKDRDFKVEVWSSKPLLSDFLQAGAFEALSMAHRLTFELTSSDALLQSGDIDELLQGYAFYFHKLREAYRSSAQPAFEEKLQALTQRLYHLVPEDLNSRSLLHHFFAQRSQEYWQEQRFAEAARSARKALDFDDRDDLTRTLLAAAYLLGGRFEEQYDFFFDLSQRDPRYYREVGRQLEVMLDRVPPEDLQKFKTLFGVS